MKILKLSVVLVVIAAMSLAGCSGNTQSPVSAAGENLQATAKVGPVKNSVAGLSDKGPIMHSVEGAGLRSYLGVGKNFGARYSAREYADGTFDGDYEINAANATGDPTMKTNGEVLKFKIYDGAGQYGGKMAVVFGKEKTGAYAGCYDLFFAIDNGKPGQTSAPDQMNNMLLTVPSLDFAFPGFGTIEDFYAMSPDKLISTLEILDCDKGNITVE